MQKNYRVSNRGRNEEEEDNDPFQKEKFLSYAVSNKTFSKLDVYLDEAIQESKYYRPLIEHMQNLSEGDKVIFHIDTYGGDLHGALAIINAISNTDAEVIANIRGACISAGTMIALSCPMVQVQKNSYMMFHQASFGSAGKQKNVEDHALFFSAKVRKNMHEIYKDFLTIEEISDVDKGLEIWIDDEEIVARLEKRLEKQKKAAKIKTKAVKKEIEA